MSHDTILHRLVRPCVRLAAPSGVTPNQVTTLRLLTALAAAGALATGRMDMTALGAGLFLLSLLLDRADGELARQTGQFSASGHAYDLASDCIANAAVLVGLGVGRTEHPGWVGPAMGLSAGLSVGVLFWLLNVVGRGDAATRFGQVRKRPVLDPDDAMVLLPFLIWAGFATPTLVFAAVVTPAAALWLGAATLHGRLSSRADQAGGEAASPSRPVAIAAVAPSSRRQR